MTMSTDAGASSGSGRGNDEKSGQHGDGKQNVKITSDTKVCRERH